jgi:hypothetical protein
VVELLHRLLDVIDLVEDNLEVWDGDARFARHLPDDRDEFLDLVGVQETELAGNDDEVRHCGGFHHKPCRRAL